MFNVWEKMKIMFPLLTNEIIIMSFLKSKQLTGCLLWKFLKEFRESFGEMRI